MTLFTGHLGYKNEKGEFVTWLHSKIEVTAEDKDQAEAIILEDHWNASEHTGCTPVVKIFETLELTFYEDPGHGWLEVPKALLFKFNVENSISSCSYMENEAAYLEEDQDYGVFFNAVEATGKYNIKLKEIHQEVTPIRQMRPYRC